MSIIDDIVAQGSKDKKDGKLGWGDEVRTGLYLDGKHYTVRATYDGNGNPTHVSVTENFLGGLWG